MGWYTVTKVIKGIPYIYRQRSRRDGKAVRSESVYIGRGDGGGRGGKLTITTDESRESRKITIKAGNTRFGFHGARNGFSGRPRPSDEGQLGAGFYVTTEQVAERYRTNSPKFATFYSNDDIDHEFDGDLVEFDIRLLKTKTVASYDGLVALGREVLGFDQSWITVKQIEQLKGALLKQGFHALKISAETIDDPEGEPELPQMVVFPEAIHRLRKIGAELTLHLKNTTGRFEEVAEIPERLMQTFRFTSDRLLLSSETKKKIRRKHPEVKPADFGFISSMLVNGELVRDRLKRAMVIFQKRQGKWWRLAVKAAKNGEPIVLTYHRTDERHYKNAKKLP